MKPPAPRRGWRSGRDLDQAQLIIVRGSLPGFYLGNSPLIDAEFSRNIVLDVPLGNAASYGTFQILGENHAACGFTTVRGFVDAMMASENDHLTAFVRFVKSSPPLLTALRLRQWPTFARHYNGPKYAKNGYDAKMKSNYDMLVAASRATPAPR
jgi:hypothetical protein